MLEANYGPGWQQRLSEASGSVRQLGARAWLALFGIAVGCAALIAMMNIGYSAAQHARQLYRGLGSDLLVVNLQAPDQSATPLPLGDLPLVIRAVAPLAFTVSSVQAKGISVEAMVAGSTAQLLEVLPLQVAQGRLLSAYDDWVPHVLLGASLATELQTSTGERVQLGTYLFDVVGVLAAQGYNPMLPVNFDDAVLMPLSGMRRLGTLPEVATLVAAAADAASMKHAASSLEQHLRARLVQHDVDVQLPRQMLESMAGQSRVMTGLLAGTAAIALLLGGVGVMNVMVMNVTQRRCEIGVRLALGARARYIAWLFLLESLLLSVAGALLGVLLGLAGGWLFARSVGWGFALDMSALPLGVGSSLVLGLFFGMQPALAAARLQPAAALRDE